MALAEQTADAFPPPAPGADYDAGREEQHIRSTMAARSRLSEMEQAVEALTAQADEIATLADHCENQFEITIMDDGNHFVCSGYAYIDDGTHVFSPISPMVQSEEVRLDTLSCGSTTFPIGSGQYLVWLEYNTQLPEVYIAWGSQLPADTSTSKFVHIGTIPAASVDGSCRQATMMLNGPAWLSGLADSTFPFQIYWQVDPEGNRVYVRNGCVNGIQATNGGPWAAAADTVFYIETHWTAVTESTEEPYELSSATLQEDAISIYTSASAPTNVCPEVDSETGALTDGTYYVRIGTQTSVDGAISVENDNITRSIGITFCLPCEFRTWPAG